MTVMLPVGVARPVDRRRALVLVMTPEPASAWSSL
jgi:hypothetical protein